MKKPIAQEHGAGCAVACVAFVLGISYKKTLTLFTNGNSRAIVRGFYGPEIITALAKGGKKYVGKHINGTNKKEIFRESSIVFVRRSKLLPHGHYLCRTNKLWMNSWFNSPSIKNVTARFQKRLPGKPTYVILPNP